MCRCSWRTTSRRSPARSRPPRGGRWPSPRASAPTRPGTVASGAGRRGPPSGGAARRAGGGGRRGQAGSIVEVLEQKDCRTDAERAIREINPGIYACAVGFLREAVAALRPNNAAGELYLTDIVAFASNLGKRVVNVPSRAEVLVG